MLKSYKSFKPSGRKFPYLSILILCVAFVLPVTVSIVISNNNAKHEKKLARNEFENIVNAQEESFASQLLRYEAALQSTTGFIDASSHVTKSEFEIYINSLDIKKSLPGANGIGFIQKVDPMKVNSFLKSTKEDGIDDFKISELTGKDQDLFVIKYIVPENGNFSAIGVNIAPEENRKATAEKSAKSGNPSITKKIPLIKDVKNIPGFVIYFPVYDKSKLIDTESQRIDATIGWIYTPVLASDFINVLLPDNKSDLGLEIYEGSEAIDSKRIYDGRNNVSSNPMFFTKRTVSLFQQNWVVEYSSTKSFESSVSKNDTLLIDLAGLITGIISFLISLLIIRRNAVIEKQVETKTKELAESEERLVLAITGTKVGLFDIPDVTQDYTYLSPQFQFMLGYKEDELLNHRSSFNELRHPDDSEAVMATVREAIDNCSTFDVEYRLQKKDKTYLWVNAKGVITIDEKSKRKRLTGSIADISERKNVDRIKDEFVSVVSHELRTPLTSIRGSLGLISEKMKSKLPNDISSLFDIANKNSARLVEIVDDILDIDKIASGEMVFDCENCNVYKNISESVQRLKPYAESYGVKIIVNDIDDNIEAYFDPERVSQVLSNLISNAIKFSPRESEIYVSAFQKDEVVRISIEDFGQGIPFDFQNEVFSKFAQADGTSSRKHGGSGLGLYISKQYIDSMSGTIGFTSKKNGGTIFWIELPIEVPQVISK